MNGQTMTGRSRTVLVVAVDLSDESEDLLSTARELVRPVDDAELHVVHVVRPEPLRERLADPVVSLHTNERVLVESAQWVLLRWCESVMVGSRARWVVHTPVGDPVTEVTRVAREVGAHIIAVAAHDGRRRRLFHRSVLARIARSAPCSVLTIRDRRKAAQVQATMPAP